MSLRLLLLAVPAVLALAAPPASARSQSFVRAQPGWAARVVDRGERSVCLQAGQLRDGRLGRVFASGDFRAHTANEFTICGPRAIGRRSRATLVRTALDRPEGRGARRVAVLAGGLAGRGAWRAEVSSGGRYRRQVPIRRDGAWLVVLPRGAEQAQLRIVVRYRGKRKAEVSDYGRGRRHAQVVDGSARIELTQIDPATRRRLGLLVWRTTRAATCSVLGDVADGQVGQLSAESGEFFEYPINEGGSCLDLRHASTSGEPLLGLSIGASFGEDPRPRGTVVGFARADVASLVIRGLGSQPLRPRLSRRSHAFFATSPLPDGAQETVPPVTVEITYRSGRVDTRSYPGPDALRAFRGLSSGS